MRKILVFTVTIFLLLASGFFFQNKIYAQAYCQLNINPPISPTFNGPITITSSTPCFDPAQKYMALINPISSTNHISLGNDPQFKDPTTLTATLNFPYIRDFMKRTMKDKYTDSDRTWAIRVCRLNVKNAIDTCVSTGSNFVGLVYIKLNSSTTTFSAPTPEPDLPIIDRANQTQCIFGPDSEISLTATNILPNQPYHWWLSEANSIGTITSGSDTILTFTMPNSKTLNLKSTDEKPEGYVVCLDTQNKNRVTTHNCITLFFKNFDPKEPGRDVSCSPNNRGDIILTPTPKSPLPPCAQWLLLNGSTIAPQDPRYNNSDFKDRKCGALQTGIANISTEPQGFVRSIFGLVLGLAGGIALILIIIAGYRLMASQGNPEQITAARDQLISAIVGLLFIILSFVILQVIGVDILKIPGFSQ